MLYLLLGLALATFMHWVIHHEQEEGTEYKCKDEDCLLVIVAIILLWPMLIFMKNTPQ